MRTVGHSLESVKRSEVLASYVRHRVEDSGALGRAHLPLQPQSRRLSTPDFLTLSNLDPAPQVVSIESSLFSKFAAPEAVERSSKSFHEMNATARNCECLTEKGLCEHELSSTGWFRDSLPPGVIFRPYPAGPPNPKLAGESDVPKATAREVQASNVSGRLSLLLQDSLAHRFASSRSTRPNLILTSK